MTSVTLSPAAEALEREPGSASSRAKAHGKGRRRRLSHEFGTPLNAILGNVELMLDGSTGPLSGEARACLAEMQDAGNELLRQSRLLVLLVQALETKGPQSERATPLGPSFEAALRQAQSTGRRALPQLDGAAAGVALVGDPFWLHTLIRCMVDLYVSGDAAAPLEIDVQPPGRIRIGWSGFRETALPATATALIRRIVELHGGRMLAAARDAFVFSWPGCRLRLVVEPGTLDG